MRVEFDGNWKILLIIGALGLAVFLFVGTIFGLLAGLLLGIFKGLWLLLRFAFSSIWGFALLLVLAYLGYRGYERIKGVPREKVETVEYTDEDFER
ncbi:MAG: hypothetical protein V5A87_01765 [Candidatus Bipolaricaulota bacterium]